MRLTAYSSEILAMDSIRIQTEDFSAQDEVDALLKANPKIGGVVTFLGTVRDFTSSDAVTALELEHYPGMTERELERIVAAAHAQFPVEAIRVIHRVGYLEVGQNIVLVIAAGRHRAESFEACRYVIDHLKVRATLWKKEISPSGSRWVESCPGCEAAASQWADLKQGAKHTHAVSAVEADHHHHGDHQHGDHQHGGGPQHGHAEHRDHGAAVASWPGLRVGIVTLSDSRTLATDKSGDALEGAVLSYGGRVVQRTLLADDQAVLAACLCTWADEQGVDVILTTGGTGPSPRDITPEATRQVCNRELPGFAELIRAAGMQQTRNAVFTRGVTALRGQTLVVNLPGSTRGALHSLQAVADLIPHALRMAAGAGH
ncbi:molybdopterin synthase subunit MoaE [Magnetococcus marinus MC-1]|uniref:Molybdopterin adenylyltransferase n=1 Tax=Magnetococcus marinus (strain ATCC BAA-1437 / JCM 17883 / MC-1) TaxID=156889 RepID=A0L7R1_MAGMM|nr:molybdenum cofactor biosynthesis protein MoaE [Magnetococcus marinus]ABK44004.1 molybdopterin synthase subunit MoaE [Magnetococcus marinus MC-1]